MEVGNLFALAEREKEASTTQDLDMAEAAGVASLPPNQPTASFPEVASASTTPTEGCTASCHVGYSVPPKPRLLWAKLTPNTSNM